MPKDENNNGTSSNGSHPYLGLTDAERKAQQQQLSELLDELIAEGFDGSEYLPQLEAEADLEAQAAISPE